MYVFRCLNTLTCTLHADRERLGRRFIRLLRNLDPLSRNSYLATGLKISIGDYQIWQSFLQGTLRAGRPLSRGDGFKALCRALKRVVENASKDLVGII